MCACVCVFVFIFIKINNFFFIHTYEQMTRMYSLTHVHDALCPESSRHTKSFVSEGVRQIAGYFCKQQRFTG